MNTSRLKSILLFLVALLTMPHVAFAVSGSSGPICLQTNRGNQDSADQTSPSFLSPDPASAFLPPSREFLRPLVRANRLRNEGDDNDAAELVGQFLAEVGDEDFLVVSNRSKGTAISVKRAATEMLGSLPDSAIETYRVRFGVPARQRLTLAIAESDYFEISQVMQRYPYTDAGIEAAMLMGHHHFDGGRALLAAESFQTALDLDKFNGKSDPQLSILTAVSWSLARRPKLAETVLKDLARSTGGKFRLGDQEILIDKNNPLAAIKSFTGSGPLDSSSKVDQWLLVGGNARSKATTTDGFPVGQPIWQVDVADSLASQREIKSARETISGEISAASTSSSSSPRGSLVPANVPLIVDGLVLVGNEEQVSAVDFKSGKRVWAVASGADASEMVKQQQQATPVFRVIQGRAQSTNTKAIDRAPWTDFLQGHASSDGKFIYHVMKSLAAPIGQDNNQALLARINGVKTTNILQAIDVLKQGELAWEVGGGQTTGDPRLAEISFLGAPLPIDGTLYVIGKYSQEIVLVALNSKDGKLIWLQPLASDESLLRSRYGRTSAEKNHSLTPSYSKGILVCPTGKNALVAVDTIGRRVLWGAQTNFSESSSSKSRLGHPMMSLQNPQVFVENSRVIALDISTDARLLAVSLLDGSPLMRIGKAGVKVPEALYVASVDENRVVFVEKNRVRAITSDSGGKLWETSIRKFGPPTGRGYVSELALYLPTEGNAIVKIDLENGKIVDGIYTDQPLGNLIVHQGRVISRRETSVSCFELDSKVVSELDAAAKAAGGMEQVAPDLKVKQASLLRNRGEIKQAIDLLKTIAQEDRTEHFKIELVRNATQLFESDPEYALKLFQEFENWFRFETDPNMFLGYVELLVKYGMNDNAVEKLFADDSFFNEDEADAEAPLVVRPLAGYNLEPVNEDGDGSDDDGKQEAGIPKPTQKADKGDKDSKEKSDKNESSFLKNQLEFSKKRIMFEPNQWAKTQLIRIARNSPAAVPQIRAAIEKRINSIVLSDPLLRHRMLRRFPLELVAPQARFELAEQLIAQSHVAEAENMLASILGFLPTNAEQIEATEIAVDGFSKESFVDLWSKIRDAQYGATTKVAADSEPDRPFKSVDYDRVDVSIQSSTTPYSRDFPTVVQARGEVANRLFKGKCLSIWGTQQEFEVLSPTGESETRFKMFKEEATKRSNVRSGSGWLQTNHSLAILRQGDYMLGIDLPKLDLGQVSVRWKKTVNPINGWRPEIGDELDLIFNPPLRPEDVTASFPTTGCCCFIKKDKLSCVDAFTGTTLWTRSIDANHGYVFADGNQLVTMDAKLNESSVFDLRTGERLRTRAVSDLISSLWTVDGASFTAVGSVQQRNLEKLTDFQDYRPAEVDADGKKRARPRSSKPNRFLSRYDAVKGEFVWQKVFTSLAKISRISGERFMVLSGDNQLYFFDAKTGEELAKLPSGLTTAQRKKVRFIGSYEHQGKDLVVLADNKIVSVSANGYRAQAASNSLGTFFSGKMMLFSQDKLEPVWDRVAELDGFQFLPMLPSASPMLIFDRRIQVASNSQSRNVKRPGVPAISGRALQMLALDMKNGRVVVNEIVSQVGSLRFTSPIVDPTAGKIDIDLAGREFRFNLEKSPDEPPSPVASVTKINPVPLVFEPASTVTKAVDGEFDIEELNKRLVRQAEEYEASLEDKRKRERALLEKETSR